MITKNKNAMSAKRRLVIVSVVLFLSISILWLVFEQKKHVELTSHEVAVAEKAVDVEAENDYIRDSNKGSDCEGDTAAQTLLYYERLLGDNLHNSNFAILQLGGREFQLPDGSFEMTGYHKYLEDMNLVALENLAESGDQEAMVALSDRLTKKWSADFNSPLAQLTSGDITLENPDFVEALPKIDLMIETSEYQKARDWALKAAEHGKFSPLNLEIIDALDEHHTILQMKYDFSQTDQEQRRITDMLKALEEEYYKVWYIYHYTFEGFDDVNNELDPNFYESYVPDHISQEQLDKLEQESIEAMKQLESTVRSNGAMMPRELFNQISFITDPEQLTGVKASSLYTPEEYVDKLGMNEFAKYDAMSEGAQEEAVDCLTRLKEK
jgi:hypothetical protein